MDNKKQIINACIVDDDIFSGNLLKKIIDDYSPEVRVLNVFTDPYTAIMGLRDNLPDLIFLDVEMPEMNGIELLKLLPTGTEKKVIYVTGHDKFAIDAVKLGVQDYLMKPITAAQVKESIDNFIRKTSFYQEQLVNNLANKMMINRQDKLHLINIDDILYLEAEGPYTHFHMLNGEQIKSSKSLAHYRRTLEDNSDFFSIHRSYFLNFKHIVAIEKDSNNEGVLIMTNEQKIEFSAGVKNKLIQTIQDVLAANVRI
jgi:two-component system, LytTR family, response regulator